MDKIIVENIEIEIYKKNIKNINLSVHPPYGDVRMSVPDRMEDESIKSYAKSKLSWIKKQRLKYKVQEKTISNKVVSGEYHSLFGKRYLLMVTETKGKQYVELINECIILHVRENSSQEKREKLIYEFYRTKLKESVPDYIEKWEKIIGVSVNEWGIKLMKTKWGTCNIRSKKIWINLELAKKSHRCLEYIVVHELIHLIERYHNRTFYDYMEKFLPDWKNIKKELNGIVCEI